MSLFMLTEQAICGRIAYVIIGLIIGPSGGALPCAMLVPTLQWTPMRSGQENPGVTGRYFMKWG
jgi:hypothetical protein